MLTGKPTRRIIGRPRHRWEDIRIYLNEIEVNTRHWVDSSQDRNYCPLERGTDVIVKLP